MAEPVTIELPGTAVEDCGVCAERVRDGLESHRGVLRVEPVPGRRAIAIGYDPELCSPDCLDGAARDLRRTIDDSYRHRSSSLEGMDCADCAQTIERAVARLDGVTDVAVSFPASTLRVEFRPEVIGFERIASVVRRLGYGIPGEATSAGSRRFSGALDRRVTTTLATLLLLVGLILDVATSVLPVPAYAAAALVGGLPLARSGIAALLATRRPDINLLMTVAVIGAVAIGAWLEAALVVVLFAIGAALEERAATRARRELAGLVSLTPPSARVRRRTGEGPFAVVQEMEVDVAAVVLGDLVVIRPGERVPIDGVVRDGASSVDQAPITGESVPVDKTTGDRVFAGTMNVQGLLVVEARSAPGDTTLERIAVLVAEAQTRKSPSERWVDAFARWYTPAVVGVAVLVAAIPPLVGLAAFSSSFYAALALLILACPCALVISTPVAIVSALGRASASGVLVKGGAHLEQAARIRAVAFDKTGTLTAARPEVVALRALQGSEDELLRVAAAVEAGSEHPLARAIVEAAPGERVPADVEGFEALAGLGARARVGGRTVTVGDLRLVAAPEVVLREAVEAMRRAGSTAVVVIVDDEPIGVIGIADAIRPEAAEAMRDLRHLGVGPLVMLTGDNAVTAAAVAEATGVDRVEAGLLPEDKARAVSAMGDDVAMLGDGVNDAPALATAALGVAMGSAGSDTAIEVADVAIMGDDPRKLAGLVGLGRWTRSVVRQNIAFSLGSKLLAAGVLAAGALPLWGAVAADVGASLIVVGNGLRLVRGRPRGATRHDPILRPVDAGPQVGGAVPTAADPCGDGCCGSTPRP
ncbi:MAG: heavy metal translocating P-type ATPase [Thermoleophilia bacterium]